MNHEPRIADTSSIGAFRLWRLHLRNKFSGGFARHLAVAPVCLWLLYWSSWIVFPLLTKICADWFLCGFIFWSELLAVLACLFTILAFSFFLLTIPGRNFSDTFLTAPIPGKIFFRTILLHASAGVAILLVATAPFVTPLFQIGLTSAHLIRLAVALTGCTAGGAMISLYVRSATVRNFLIFIWIAPSVCGLPFVMSVFWHGFEKYGRPFSVPQTVMFHMGVLALAALPLLWAARKAYALRFERAPFSSVRFLVLSLAAFAITCLVFWILLQKS